MQHMGQNHGGQLLLADSVGQLRWLDRDTADAISAAAKLLSVIFALGTPSKIDDILGVRMQRPAVRQLVSNSLRARSQYLQENIWTTARCRTAPSRTSLLLTDTHIWASAVALPRCVVSRYATTWAESLEGAMSGHQSWAKQRLHQTALRL